MTFDEFLKQYKDKYWNYDGKFGFQCFDLFQYYNRDVVGGGFVGGSIAKEIWNTYPKNLYTAIRNTPSFVPQKGDVAIWAGSYNANPDFPEGAGHVGIVADDKSTTKKFKAFVQNDPLGSKSVVREYNYDHVIGFLRPVTNPMVDELKIKVSELEETLKDVRANRDKYRKQYATLKELYAQCKEQNEDYKKEVAELDGVLNTALTENRKLKEQIEEYKKKKQISLSDFSKQELLKALFS